MNLVVVSNRVARGKPNEPMTGGLAAALLPVVEKSGAIWVGSSGRVRDGNQKEPFAEIEALGAGALAMLDLPAAHYGGYYEGFANSALWPALHSRADLIRASQDDYVSYREVNAFMARALLRFRKPDSAFWIQDYHFLALGAELRDLGVTQPIGFFLHTPWPTRSVIGGVPHHRDLIEAMLAYDLIGFQTEEDCENFLSYAQSDLGLVVHDGIVDLAPWPNPRRGISRSASIRRNSPSRPPRPSTHPDVSRLRRSLNGEKLAIGVDRLDYSKGLINRIKAFDRMWTLHPSAFAHGFAAADRDAVARRDRGLWQSAERGRETRQRRQRPSWRSRLDADPLSQQGLWPGRARGPLSHRAGRRGDAAAGRHEPGRQGICRRAKPADPGVLVLSKFAGAANELDTALLVNPHDIDGMARTIATALSMPLTERRMRWEAMMTKLRAGTIQQWFADFIDALQDSRLDSDPLGPIIAEPPALTRCAPSPTVARGITRA